MLNVICSGYFEYQRRQTLGQQGRLTGALKMKRSLFSSESGMLPAKANTAGRESGKSFVPTVCEYEKNGFGGY